jgi:hypothetical protein
MRASKYDYQAFFPRHSASAHRIMALIESLDHYPRLDTVTAVDDELTARRLCDALNSRLLGRRNHAERFTAARAGLPDDVQAAVRRLPIAPDGTSTAPLPLAAHLHTEPVDGILLFPAKACVPGRCDECANCGCDCRTCPVCHNDDRYPCEACRPPDLTPRTALALAMAGDVLADQCLDLPGCVRDRDWLLVPGILQDQSEDFVRRMARCFDDLTADLRDGLRPVPRSIGEQIALHTMIERAEVFHAADPALLASYEPLIPATRHDNNFDALFDTLLDDADHVGYLGHIGPVDEDLFIPFRNDPDRP